MLRGSRRTSPRAPVGAADLGDSRQQLALVLEDVGTVEHRWQAKSGEYRWFSASRRVVRDGSGQAMALVGVSRDVTAQKRDEEALRGIKETLDRLLEASPAS